MRLNVKSGNPPRRTMLRKILEWTLADHSGVAYFGFVTWRIGGATHVRCRSRLNRQTRLFQEITYEVRIDYRASTVSDVGPYQARENPGVFTGCLEIPCWDSALFACFLDRSSCECASGAAAFRTFIKKVAIVPDIRRQ